MTGFLFDLLYSAPFVFFFGNFINRYILKEELRLIVYVLMGTGCVFVLMYRHFSSQLRIVVSGILVFVLLGAFFAVRSLNPAFFGQYGMFILGDFVTGLLCCVVSVILSSFLAGKIIYAVSLIAGLMVAMFSGVSLNAFPVACALLGVVLVGCEMLQNKRSSNIKKYMVYLFPIFLCFALLLGVAKAPDKPYDWHNFTNAWNRVKEISYDLKQKLFHNNDEDYEESMIGFSEQGNFGEALTESGYDIMSIISSRIPGDKIYLVGTAFDVFEDMEWKHSGLENDNTRYFDYLEGMCTAYAIDSSHNQDYVRTENMDITFLSFSSRHAFAPAKTINLVQNNTDEKLVTVMGDLLFENTVGYKTDYKVSFSKLNRNPVAMEKLTSGEYFVDEENYKRYLNRTGLKDVEELSYERFLEYKNNIEKEYLPEVTVSYKMRERLDYIESVANNPYDKLCILEEELKKLTYTLEPGPIPDRVQTEENFLDYFCFESGKGLCSHFSTAFALMARAMGIPSRFVQGYCVPIMAGEDVTVNTSMAHAWVECYLPGAGWVPFDPSPGSAFGVGNYWQTFEQKDYSVSGIGEYNKVFEQDDITENTFEEPTEDEEKERTHIDWYVIVIPLLGIILFVSGFFVLELNIFERRINRASATKKAKLLCRANMNMLSYCGYKVKEGETLEEFGRRVNGDVSKTALLFLPVFERMLYSGEDAKTEDVTLIKQSFDRIRLILKDEKKLLYYWYYLKGIRKS